MASKTAILFLSFSIVANSFADSDYDRQKNREADEATRHMLLGLPVVSEKTSPCAEASKGSGHKYFVLPEKDAAGKPIFYSNVQNVTVRMINELCALQDPQLKDEERAKEFNLQWSGYAPHSVFTYMVLLANANHKDPVDELANAILQREYSVNQQNCGFDGSNHNQPLPESQCTEFSLMEKTADWIKLSDAQKRQMIRKEIEKTLEIAGGKALALHYENDSRAQLALGPVANILQITSEKFARHEQREEAILVDSLNRIDAAAAVDPSQPLTMSHAMCDARAASEGADRAVSEELNCRLASALDDAKLESNMMGRYSSVLELSKAAKKSPQAPVSPSPHAAEPATGSGTHAVHGPIIIPGAPFLAMAANTGLAALASETPTRSDARRETSPLELKDEELIPLLGDRSDEEDTTLFELPPKAIGSGPLAVPNPACQPGLALLRMVPTDPTRKRFAVINNYYRASGPFAQSTASQCLSPFGFVGGAGTLLLPSVTAPPPKAH